MVCASRRQSSLPKIIALSSIPAMRNLHAWTHRTEDGEKREVRAVKNQGRWKLQSKLRHEAEWTYHEAPERSDLEELRDILWRKYQRRRASHEDVLLADKMLAELAAS